MPLSRNIKSYLHIAQVLDAAIARGGGRYTCENEKAAVRWRMEAYYYRRLFEENVRGRLKVESRIAVNTPYDGMNLQLEGRVVVIGFKQSEGRLEDFEGKEIPLAPKRRLEEVVPEQDGLEEAAEAVRKSLIERGEIDDGLVNDGGGNDGGLHEGERGGTKSD